MQKIRIISFFLALIAVGLSAQESKFIVAVMDLEARGIGKGEAKALTDRFSYELGSLGVHEIMERQQMDMILKEQGFQQSGACSDASCVVQVGQLIAVDKMITGSVGKVGSIYTVTLKMIDVESGKIVRQVKEDCNCPIEQMLTSTMKRVAMKMAGMEVKEEEQIEISTGNSSLFVKSNPSGAKVYLDGKLKEGVTPLTLSGLPKGTHMVRVEKDKKAAESAVALIPNEIVRVELVLELMPTRMQVISDPPEAHLYLRGKYQGLTPKAFKEFSSGNCDLRIFKLGFKEINKTVSVGENENNLFNFKLETAPADVATAQKKTESRIHGRLSSRKWFKRGNRSLLLGLVSAGIGAGLIGSAEEAYKNYLETSNSDTANKLRSESRTKGMIGSGLVNIGAGLGGLAGGMYSVGIAVRF